MIFRSLILVGFSGLFLNGCLPSIDPFSGSGNNTPNPEQDPDHPDHEDPSIPLTEDPLDQNNRFRSSDIKKVLFAGSFLGTKETEDKEILVTNVDKDGKEISNLEVEIDIDGTTYKIFLPARIQKVVDIDTKFFAILRYKNLSSETPDAHLIRKSDGKAWKISSMAVNPTSFSSIEIAGESRIYFAADEYAYQGMDFMDTRSGDNLSLARVFKDKDEVTLVTVLKTQIQNYALVGVDGIATDGFLSEDTWISKVTSTAPVPYSLKALNTEFSNYFFINNYAFRLVKAGVNLELRKMDEHPVYGPLIGKVEKNYNDRIYWGATVGELLVLKGSENLIVLNKDRTAIVSEPESAIDLSFPKEIEEKGGIASIFDTDAICQYRQAGTEVKSYCLKTDDLELRGSISSIDVDESGRIFAFSTIESVQDIEKLHIELNVEKQALEVTKRESVQAYTPEQTVLVPVKI